MKNNKIINYSIIATILCLVGSCEVQENFDYQKSGSTGQLGVTAWDYIQSHDSLVMLEQAINLVGIQEVYLEASGKTFLAPTNNAFKEYLQNNSYGALEDVPLPILRNALNYHIVNATVLFTDPDLMDSNNPLPYEAANGQTIYLSHNSNFQGLVNEGTSAQWMITTSNLEPTNGVIHVTPSIVYFSAPSGDLDTPDPSIQRDTIYPLYDTFINGGGQSGANFGTDPLLKVKNVSGDGDYDRKAYLMFDLNEFDQEEGVITDLKLELAVQFTHGRGINLNLYSVPDTSWTEMGLTFDSATLPEDAPISSIISSKVSAFNFNITDFYDNLENKGLISLVLDGEAGSDETDELASKENTSLNIPMLIATIASGDNVLEIITNSGFTVEKGGAFAFNNNMLEVTGAAPGDIIFTVQEVPQHGWLVKGASILEVGDRFTQNDIEVMNLLYINDGSGTEDQLTLSGRDRAGSRLEDFNVEINIEN